MAAFGDVAALFHNFFTYINTRTPADLPQGGHNKHKRGDLRQVRLGLLVAADFHIPLFHTVSGHLAALLLRAVDEHRLEAADPDRHGHGAAERGAGDAEGKVREPPLRTSTAEVGLAASRRRLLC
jgi:hypothetical protein